MEEKLEKIQEVMDFSVDMANDIAEKYFNNEKNKLQVISHLAYLEIIKNMVYSSTDITPLQVEQLLEIIEDGEMKNESEKK